jgi:hypothetical protein
LDQLLQAYAHLRLREQSEYAGRMLKEGSGLWPKEPKGQEERLSTTGNLLTIWVIFLHLLLAILILLFGSQINNVSSWLQTFAMIAALWVLGLRVLEDGLRPGLEVARLRRYRGEIAEIQHRFELAADPAAKLSLMERLEELSYRELRDFLTDHREASFVL